MIGAKSFSLLSPTSIYLLLEDLFAVVNEELQERVGVAGWEVGEYGRSTGCGECAWCHLVVFRVLCYLWEGGTGGMGGEGGREGREEREGREGGREEREGREGGKH